MRYHVVVEGEEFVVEVEGRQVQVDGDPVEAELASVAGSGSRSLLLEGASRSWTAQGNGGGRWSLHSGGRTLEAEVADERTHAIRSMARASAAAAGPKPVRAPMPGLIVKVEVAVGDTVGKGHGLVVMEAMKMENELTAESAGRVRKILVAPGDTVEKDQVLVELEAPEEGAGNG